MIASLTGFAPIPQTTPPAPERAGLELPVSPRWIPPNFPKVTVYVSVTDANGEPVVVSPTQIVIRENGEVMKPEEVGGEDDIGPLATMLVMDISGSMNSGGKLNAAKAAASAYVDQARPGDEIGLLTFNTEIEYVEPLTKDRREVARGHRLT